MYMTISNMLCCLVRVELLYTPLIYKVVVEYYAINSLILGYDHFGINMQSCAHADRNMRWLQNLHITIWFVDMVDKSQVVSLLAVKWIKANDICFISCYGLLAIPGVCITVKAWMDSLVEVGVAFFFIFFCFWVFSLHII